MAALQEVKKRQLGWCTAKPNFALLCAERDCPGSSVRVSLFIFGMALQVALVSWKMLQHQAFLARRASDLQACKDEEYGSELLAAQVYGRVLNRCHHTTTALPGERPPSSACTGGAASLLACTSGAHPPQGRKGSLRAWSCAPPTRRLLRQRVHSGFHWALEGLSAVLISLVFGECRRAEACRRM